MPANNMVLAFARADRLELIDNKTNHKGHHAAGTQSRHRPSRAPRTADAEFRQERALFHRCDGHDPSGEKGDSIYLRGYDDYERYTLKLTASKTNGMAHVAYRTRSAQALERRAAALKGSGFDVGWTDGDLGHGKTFVCKDPTGT